VARGEMAANQTQGWAIAGVIRLARPNANRRVGVGKALGGVAAASNRTRENRPSGIIGGLRETRRWAELGIHSTRVAWSLSGRRAVRSVSIPIGHQAVSLIWSEGRISEGNSRSHVDRARESASGPPRRADRGRR